MDSILRLVYDKWFIDDNGNKFPLPNILTKELVEFLKQQAYTHGIQILKDKDFLETQLNNKQVLTFYHCNFFNYFQEYLGMQHVVNTVEEDDNIYFYPIELKNYNMLLQKQTFTLNGEEHVYTVIDTLSSEAINWLKTGRVKIVASIPFEPVEPDDILTLSKFRTQLKQLGITNEDVIICVGGNSWKNSSNIKVFDFNLTLYQTAENLKNFSNDNRHYVGNLGYKCSYMNPGDLNSSLLRKNKFLSFNRSMTRQHRIMLAHVVLENNILEDGLFTFLGSDLDLLVTDKKSFVKSTLIHYFKKHSLYNNILENDQTLNFYTDRIISTMPYELDTHHLSHLEKSQFSTNNNKKEFYLDSYVNITTETKFRSNNNLKDAFFSEKIYRPIANLQPFILIGDPGSLLKLREMGFKTFSPFIDESYDLEKDNRTRFVLIETEISKLKNKSIQEIHDWYYSITDILIHNWKLLMSFYEKNPFEPFYEEYINYEHQK